MIRTTAEEENKTESVKPDDFKTSIGGQALIEGILMRGPDRQAIALRTKSGVEVKTEERKAARGSRHVTRWPFIRGVVNFGSSMAAGVRALMYAANEAMRDEAGGEDVKPSKLEKFLERKLGAAGAEKALVTVSTVLGIALSIVLFMLLPTVAAGFLNSFTDSRILKNLIEGALRIGVFIAYIALSSAIPDMYRVWQYHGAEHMAIFCYEKRLSLTVENCREQPRAHPRCGTSFMFIVMIISILTFSLMRWPGVLVRLATRLALLPVVVAVSYEIIKLAGRRENPLTRIISAPGKALQRLTTRRPDDEMLSVAIAALEAVIPEKPGDDKW